MTVVGAVLIGVIGFRIMRNVPLFDNGRVLFSTFAKADGLSEGKKILFNGVEIGTISTVELLPSDSIVVKMAITNDIPIPIDSKAFIRATDILGSKAVIIEKGKEKQLIQDGGYIRGVYDDGAISELQEKGLSLGDKVAEIGENLNKVLLNVNTTLNEPTKKELQKSVAHLEGVLELSKNTIAENRADIQKSVKSLSATLTGLESMVQQNKPEINETIKELKSQLKNLEKLSSTLDKTSKELDILLSKINSGEGTLGKLANDPSLYNQMDSLALNLQRLIQNIDRDPKRYLQHIDITLF
ncbi:MCE family protein [bacterium]|nr:MAG: MCE family protein [bacterium]